MRVAPAAPWHRLLQLLFLLGPPGLKASGVAEPPLPTVVLAILARNAEHSLPHYLGALERLDYPRARLALWCATDHNIDNTTGMLQEWLAAVGDDYAAVVWRPEGEARFYPDEEGPKHWTRERHQFLMELKQEALTFARDWGADYILFADTDNILTNKQTLRFLMEQGLPVVITPQEGPEGVFGLWCRWPWAQSFPVPQGYYRRTAEYFPTKNRQRRGCFRVPMVHSTFLVSLRDKGTAQLAFYPPHPNYTWPFDDIIVFAYSCEAAGVSVHVCNEHRFGYMNVAVQPHQGLEDEKVNFVHLILEALVDGPPMQASAHVSQPPKRPSKLGFDEVFVIGLARRPHRRARMLSSLWEMEISGRVEVFSVLLTFLLKYFPLRRSRWCKQRHMRLPQSVFCRLLNRSILRTLGVDLLPGYQDPYSGRTLTKGEIGCFLSHYSIWEEGDSEWLSDTETSSPWDDDSGRIISWTGSQKSLRGPHLDLAGSNGHSLHPSPRDEL
ncbi:PREDICTED: probable inactive glycosyltransferase 25 family member 3 [Dipodomys ordii]|uniref:Probable inactive glycosyltransferase 25 family member 3 n=1 Tax=Dipodomys ordii TaxID=10020 RepID=A0A1S3FK73_DIPOR|nr:PREDICTED: probable inactive glycosyltransferase 25 family member 3 [Dipodomys ordii]